MPATKGSRYEFAPVHQDPNGNLFLDVPDPIPRQRRPDDARPIAGEGDTLHSMAWRAYKSMLDRERDIGPSRFFWVVGQVNDVVDATEPLEQGRVYVVPSVQSLNGEILIPPRFFNRNTVT